MLSVAPGFTLNPAALHPIEMPASETPRFSEADYHSLFNDPGYWLMNLPHPMPEAQPLENINPLLREFFIAQAVLAFQTPADSVEVSAALGRIVLVYYEPWRQPDPPVPLLILTPVDKHAVNFYNRAIRNFFANYFTGDDFRTAGRYIGQALPVVLQAGIGKLTRTEAFYLYTKLISLATGAYTQIK